MAGIKIQVIDEGPLKITGFLNAEIVDDDGNPIPTDGDDVQFLCRCGHSSDKPWCDGTHKTRKGWCRGEAE